MTTVPIAFRFKGKRAYVQGPDIYDGMMGKIQALPDAASFGAVKIAFHSFISKNCNMLVGGAGESVEKPDGAFTDLSVWTPNGTILSYLTETEEQIVDRVEYDESRVSSRSTISGEKIQISGDSGYTPCEVAVSMTKQLHYKLFPTDDKWIFTQLELVRPFEDDDASQLVVDFRRNFGSRLTKSELYSAGKSIGNIYFSLIKQ